MAPVVPPSRDAASMRPPNWLFTRNSPSAGTRWSPCENTPSKNGALARRDFRNELLHEKSRRARDGAKARDRVGFVPAPHPLDAHTAGPDGRLDHPLYQGHLVERARD